MRRILKTVRSEIKRRVTVQSVDGWKSPAGTAELKSDSNQTINKYLAVTSAKSGTARSTYKGITEING